MISSNKFFWIIAFISAAALFTAGCGSSASSTTSKQAAAAEPDELDYVIRDASDYLNNNIPNGNKIVILNIQSDSTSLSNYIIDELIANAVNDRIFTVVDRQQLEAIRAEQSFQYSGEVADDEALAIGRFFGAQTIVSGTISPLGSRYRMTIRALDVQTATVQGQYNRNIAAGETVIALVQGPHFAGGTAQASAPSAQAAPARSAVTLNGTIGIAMPETHTERWIKDGSSLRDEAAKRGYNGLVQWANADQAAQNQQIEGFLTQGARALIIGNINDGVGAAVRSARRENAIIIAYDRIIQGTHDYDCYITFNNYKVGALQGESIAAGLNLAAAVASSPKNIVLFAGAPTDANANLFFQGAMDVLLPYIDRGVLRVIGPFPRHYSEPAFQQIATQNWQAPVAKARMQSLLSGAAANVVIDAVLSPNDAIARVIIEACKADAKYSRRLPVISGQDAEFDSMISIRNGEQYSTVFRDTTKLAEAAMLLADQLLRGQPVNIPGAVPAAGALAQIAYTGTGYVTTYLLDPVLITRNSNFLVPVNAGFYSASQANQLR